MGRQSQAGALHHFVCLYDGFYFVGHGHCDSIEKDAPVRCRCSRASGIEHQRPVRLRQRLDPLGAKGFCYGGGFGFRNILSNKRPILTPEDLKGQTIRVPPIPTISETMKLFGANPVPMQWGEVYLAMKQGTIDGLELPPTTMVSDKFPEVGAERQDIRQYPGGSLAANVVGGIDWDGHGLLGLEDSMDSALAGSDGSITYDRGSDGVVIPGSYRNQHEAVDGSTVQLTIDDDIQFYVQQQVQLAKDVSGARNASAVVLDAKTGEVLAMANDNTFDPSQDIGRQGDKQTGNLPVSSPFEPGSVNKIVTASSAIEFGLSNPDEVLSVPGSINMGGVNIRDAWGHGVMPYTTTGVFGKSSNVGTLMLAQRVGPERFYDMLGKFGLGQRTGVGLPGESAGIVPPIDQWSGSTFSNLPIGQGLSMTLLQMAGMYQAIANDGLRLPPRIVKSTIAADGTRTDEKQPNGIRVVTPETARTVRNMLRAVVQRDPTGVQQGTGPAAAAVNCGAPP